MKREHIKVEKRSVFGKQLRKLRRDGMVPGNVYGKELKSTAVQLPLKEFMALYREVKETGLVDLELDGAVHPVLIYNVAWNSQTQEPLHADFFKVNLKEKITTKIPVVTVGEALAVLDKKGVMLQPVSEIEVEALPTELPEKAEVNVEALAEVGDQIVAEQITLPQGVTLVSEPSQVVIKIDELVTEEAEEQAEEDAAAAEAASAEAGAEGAEAGAEGEAKEASTEGAAEAGKEEKEEPKKEEAS